MHFSKSHFSYNVLNASDPSTLASPKDSAQLKAVLEVLGNVEKSVNSDGSSLKTLDAAFIVVGSVAEGTRIICSNEADCMVVFR